MMTNVLSELEKQSLLVIPTEFSEVGKPFMISETDISIIKKPL